MFIQNTNIHRNIMCLVEKPTDGVVIPESYNSKPVSMIYSYAFCENNSLTSITISDSVTSIGDYAFSGCSNLATITVKEGTETTFTCTLPYDYTLTNGETSTSAASGTAITRSASGDNVYTKN